MSLVFTALRTAFERLVRYAPKIIVFALIVFVVQLVVRAVAVVSERFGPLVSITAGVVAFVFVAYLSFVALRFSFRTLDHPVFDFSLKPGGVFRLAAAELVLLIISLPSLILPLAVVFSSIPDVPDGIPVFLAIQLPSSVQLALLPFAILSVVLLVRFSMTGFRIVVLDETPIQALRGSWMMTRPAFFSLLAYSLIPLVLIFVLAALLLVLSVPFVFVGEAGLIAIALFAVVFSLVYLLVIDPSLSIGKAKLFEELSGVRNTDKRPR
ncbi:MAG: hypothetical protein ACMXYM_02750 [Candidatus Woesearchaeota archaeon]